MSKDRIITGHEAEMAALEQYEREGARNLPKEEMSAYRRGQIAAMFGEDWRGEEISGERAEWQRGYDDKVREMGW